MADAGKAIMTLLIFVPLASAPPWAMELCMPIQPILCGEEPYSVSRTASRTEIKFSLFQFIKNTFRSTFIQLLYMKQGISTILSFVK